MKNKLKAKLFCLATVSLLLSLMPFNSYASTMGGAIYDKESDVSITKPDRYSVSIAANFMKPGYSAKVFKEQEDNKWLKEYTTAPFARLGKSFYTIPSTVPSKIGSSTEKLGGKQGEWKIENKAGDAFSGNNRPYFTFPRASNNADSTDKKVAERVGSELVAGLNGAMTLVVKESGYEWPTDQQERVKAFFELTAALGNIKEGDNSFKFNNVQFTAKVASGDTWVEFYKNGTKIGDKYKYKINVYWNIMENGEHSDYQQRAHGDDKDSSLGSITWNQVVYYGNASYIAEGRTSSNQAYGLADGNEKPDLFERLLADVITNVINVIREWFKLESIEGLMLGKTDFYTWNGIAPVEWLKASSVIFWIMQVIAWIVLLGAVVKLFTSNLINTMNLSTRARLLEGVSDILIAALLLAMVFPVFELLVTFNTQLIDILRDLTVTNETLLADKGGTMRAFIYSKGGLAGALTAIFYLFMEIYFNAVFILRGFTVCLLFGLAPAFIVCYAFGGRWKSLTFGYVKQVIGNIYIGTFYAIAMTFFGLFLFTSGTVEEESVLVGLVLMWGFIPMTKMFKELTGIGESSFISQTASTAQNKVQGWSNQAKNTVSGGVRTGAKAAADIATTAISSRAKARTLRDEMKDKVAERNAKGENCKLSNYESASKKDWAKAVALKMAGDTLGFKSVSKMGLETLGNAYKPGKIEEVKFGGNNEVNVPKNTDGVAHEKAIKNQNGGIEYTFNKQKLNDAGIINTEKTNGGRIVEQTYNKKFIDNNPEFFKKLEEGSGADGMIRDKHLKSEGVHGYVKQGDNITVSYDTRQMDINNLRNDGDNIILERGTTTTKATANLTEQINLPNNNPNQPK